MLCFKVLPSGMLVTAVYCVQKLESMARIERVNDWHSWPLSREHDNEEEDFGYTERQYCRCSMVHLDQVIRKANRLPATAQDILSPLPVTTFFPDISCLTSCITLTLLAGLIADRVISPGVTMRLWW